jgi:DNA-binding transcriptional LysR family regulator
MGREERTMAQLDRYLRGDLKPRQLHLLVALDDFRNIGKAAGHANVTQPAISKALAELERGLGIKLFERSARGVNPTVYGECLIRHARSMLDELAQTRDELRGLVTGTSGKVCIGALSSTVNTLLPQSLALLKTRYPGTNVLVRENIQEILLPDLWNGKLDLLIGRLPATHAARGLEEKILFTQPVSIVAGRRHALARKKSVSWSDLKNIQWVLPPMGTLLRDPVEKVFEEHGLTLPGNAVETISANVIARYVQLSDAIAVMASDVAKYYEDLGVVSILAIEFSRQVPPIGVVWNQERPLSPSALQMMQCLEEVAAEMENARARGSAKSGRVMAGIR